jgi:hypothetical protein
LGFAPLPTQASRIIQASANIGTAQIRKVRQYFGFACAAAQHFQNISHAHTCACNCGTATTDCCINHYSWKSRKLHICNLRFQPVEVKTRSLLPSKVHAYHVGAVLNRDHRFVIACCFMRFGAAFARIDVELQREIDCRVHERRDRCIRNKQV